MFFLPAVAALVAAPTVLKVTNRFLEEYILPKRAIKKGVNIYPIGFDLAITENEMKKLQGMGALQILQVGTHRHYHLATAGMAAVCSYCSRLKS